MQFEKNLEDDFANFFNTNGLTAFTSRGTARLGVSNIQCLIDYEGAMTDSRMILSKKHEYDLHEASLNIAVSTYRDDRQQHHTTIGAIRSLMLNSKVPFSTYFVYDIMPRATSTVEDEEQNTDETTLVYALKFKVDLNKI